MAGRRRLGLATHRSGLRRWRAGDGRRATPPLDQLPLGRRGRWTRGRRRRYGLATADEPLIPRVAATPRRPFLLARHHLALGIPAIRHRKPAIGTEGLPAVAPLGPRRALPDEERAVALPGRRAVPTSDARVAE
ncbi:MAG: hypothetical protein KIT69_02385 [Propionibacteriaceae bacterium]|nr:hypothetical protein [Propionibacteriaceae bacterium]